MTGEPPSLSPMVHLSPTLDPEVIDATFCTSFGASGLVNMIPALIVKVGSENTEGPTTLIALTMA